MTNLYQHDEDARLVARLKNYDPDAVSEVVYHYGDALFRYVRAIVGDHHSAEDVVSETYLRMLERIHAYSYRGVPLRAWLYRIAHNLAINLVTRDRRHTVELLVDVVEQRADPAVTVGAQQEHEELGRALAELTEEQQQVVLLRFVEERSVSEVADLLEKSEGAVKQLQHRALRSLGRLLERASATTLPSATAQPTDTVPPSATRMRATITAIPIVASPMSTPPPPIAVPQNDNDDGDDDKDQKPGKQ